ncbi:DUF4382 domain-containing protein [Halobacterium rubrum]|uniref:DUF4382 domain-containing protein n=1 Tax=Halobacterium TaxID=2239 RepID=UPI001F36E502|nr:MULTISPECIES: DUF4382 domain-containing protein [Halobacterium]MDH5019470.1 DUF4382 domain-containing protein [Halobacterium rubrum]
MRDKFADTTASRRDYLKAAGALGAAGLAGLAGCTGGSGSSTGTLSTTVKDAPGDIADFETCVVTIEGIWLKDSESGDAADATATEDETETDDAGSDATTAVVEEQDAEDVDESDGREYHEFDEAQEADLVELQDGDSALVDDREVETGSYAFLQLDVSGVSAPLADGGGDADVGTPGNAPLQFKEPFEVREDQRTSFVADFTPVKRGQTGSYLLQPVASGTEVTYEDVTTSEE